MFFYFFSKYPALNWAGKQIYMEHIGTPNITRLVKKNIEEMLREKGKQITLRSVQEQVCLYN